MTLRKTLASIVLSAVSSGIAAQAVHFDMTLSGDKITETVTGNQFGVESQLTPFCVDGIDGRALRFDGYSNYVMAPLALDGLNDEELTITTLLAAETYPMMNVAEAENVPTYATVFGNYDEGTKRGFALQLSSQGDLCFVFGSAYSGGYRYAINGDTKLSCGRWHRVSAVLSKSENYARLYLDGAEIGSCRMSRSAMQHSDAMFWIGRGANTLTFDGFNINTFCGLIDDIAVYDGAMTVAELQALPMADEGDGPDFRYPSSRYAHNSWRPQYHGMPSGGWTNECHGMTYADGRYHVFFQKNANGPYMARLHWGHISSPNLYKWTEEPIAIAPGEAYDIKGCWSGCVFEDGAFNGGRPTIIYTAVDNAKATMALAAPKDEALLAWEKQGVIVNGRPAGLSDDFRDPYFFAAHGEKYIIVGTSKNGMGACTLHRYNGGSWTNDGDIFFQATSTGQHGTFWEMPNVTPMPNGKWLFTCTPLGTSVGVRTLCWVGTIDAAGHFVPDTAQPQTLEMGGVSKDGYGLLSPTIYKHGDKTLMLGIVPDKLPGFVNKEMGWAHNYSLPREISLDADGQIVQKPYSGLAAMRYGAVVEYTGEISAIYDLDPVKGAQVEIMADYTIADGNVGMRFFKSAAGAAVLGYDPGTGMLTLDLTSLPRRVNDNVYGGIYQAALPQSVKAGEHLKLHVFIDGSIVDIFVNDKWAYSVRVFPTDADAVGAELFADTPTDVSCKAWTLDADHEDPSDVSAVSVNAASSPYIYNLAGQRIASASDAKVYIKDGKKIMN